MTGRNGSSLMIPSLPCRNPEIPYYYHRDVIEVQISKCVNMYKLDLFSEKEGRVLHWCLATHTHTHTYTYTYTYTHTYAYTHIHTYTHTYAHTYTHTYAYTHIYRHTHIHIHTHTHICIHTYTHIHKHTHILTDIHTQTQTHTNILTHTHTHTLYALSFFISMTLNPHCLCHWSLSLGGSWHHSA